jgi:hypothetical protein
MRSKICKMILTEKSRGAETVRGGVSLMGSCFGGEAGGRYLTRIELSELMRTCKINFSAVTSADVEGTA